MGAPLLLPLGPRQASSVAKAAGPVAGVLVVLAIAVALLPWRADLRAGIALGLVVLAGLAHHVLSRRRRPPAGWLTVDDQGIRRPGDRALADWREPLGVSVLGNAARTRFVLAMTSPRATRMLAVRVLDAGDVAEAPSLLDRAVTVAEGDLRADDTAVLCAADAERLLAAIARRSPGALDRLYLSDAAGDPVVLDRGELRVGARRIDLTSALEWKAFAFQELGAHAASVCQAMWMRQGDGELVLVAPLADGAPPVQSTMGDPPPRDLRRAVDRLFMAPLRRAIERAPRISRAPLSPTAHGPRPSSP